MHMSNKVMYSAVWFLMLLSMGFLSFSLFGNLTKVGWNAEFSADRSKILFTKLYSEKESRNTHIVNDTTLFKGVPGDNETLLTERRKQLVAQNVKEEKVENISAYTMRDTKVNPFNFKFLKTGENICDKKNPPYIILLCLTQYYDVENRQIIRETWGSVAKNGTWPRNPELPVVKLVFLFGGHADTKVKQTILDEETELYNDVVMADFKDSYVNLTYKVMMGLKWVTMYCQNATYVVKVDQDMFLHIPNLVHFLKGANDSDQGIVVGYVNSKARVLRTGKWGLNRDRFPLTSYPPYTNGNSYVISGKATSKMLEAAERMPYIFIEDAFITGIVRTVVGLDIIDHQGFARWSDRPPRLCSFHNKDRIAATNTDNNLKRNVWKAQFHPNLKNCFSVEKRNQ